MSLNLKKYKADLIDKWNKFTKSKKENSWLLFGFEAKTYNLIHCGSGDYGIEELIEELSDGQIMYGAVSMKDLNSGFQKIVFIFWQGVAVPCLVKSKVDTFRTEISNFFKGSSIEITATSEDELSISEIKNKLKINVGSNYSCLENKSLPEATNQETFLYNKSKNSQPQCVEPQVQNTEQLTTKVKALKIENNYNTNEKPTEITTKEMDKMNKKSNVKDEIKTDNTFSVRYRQFNHAEDLKFKKIDTKNSFVTAKSNISLSSESQKDREETRLREITKTIKQSKTEYATNNFKAPSSYSETFNRKDDQKTHKFKKIEPTKTCSSQKSKPVDTISPERNINTVERIKDIRKKEMDEMIKQSSVKEMKTQFKSFETSSSHVVTDSKAKISTCREKKSPIRKSSEKPLSYDYISAKKELPSISSTKLLIQNHFQQTHDVPSNMCESGVPSTKHKEISTLENSGGYLNKSEEYQITVRVLYDYIADEDDELSIEEGEILKIVGKDGDWWNAINLKGNQGNVPASYVEVIDSSKKTLPHVEKEKHYRSDNSLSCERNLIQNKESMRAEKNFSGAESLKYEEKDILSVKDVKIQDFEREGSNWSNEADSIDKTDQISSENAEEIYDNISEELLSYDILEGNNYVAAFSYEKDDENELTIEEDELLTIIGAEDSGWSLVRNEKGEEGYVPSNFLIKI